MCDLCRHYPCASNCPNAPEPVAMYTCDNCGEGIFDGEHYYKIDNVADVKTLLICDECMRDSKCYAEYEEYEPDPMDIWKAREERRLIEDND